MIGSKAAKVTIYVKQGSDFAAQFQLKDSTGAVVLLAGSAFAGQIRKTKQTTTTAASFTFTIVANTVTYSLAKEVSSGMVAGELETDDASKYVYDIEWTKPSGVVERIQEGALILSREVTR